MCDYSLEARESRPAQIGDRIRSTAFPATTTRGFCPADEPSVAVCLLPGTELAFEEPVAWQGMWPTVVYGFRQSQSRTAVFRKVNEDNCSTHHDALELDDGSVVLVTHLRENQMAKVLQLPADDTERLLQPQSAAAPAVPAEPSPV